MYPQLVFHGLDGHQLAGKVLQFVACFRAHGERVRIKVDNIGIGAACFESLFYASKEHGLEVYGVCNSANPTSQPPAGPGYANLGVQTWFAARDWFRDGAIADADEQRRLGEFLRDSGMQCQMSTKSIAMLQGELTGRVYEFDARGRYILEPKEKFKARIGRSPDRADSAILSIYEPPTLGSIRTGGRRRGARGTGGY